MLESSDEKEYLRIANHILVENYIPTGKKNSEYG
jgi:hypothetical protein